MLERTFGRKFSSRSGIWWSRCHDARSRTRPREYRATGTEKTRV